MKMSDLFRRDSFIIPRYDIDPEWTGFFGVAGQIVELTGHKDLMVPMAVPKDDESVGNVIALLVNSACRGRETDFPNAHMAVRRLSAILEDPNTLDCGFGAVLVPDERVGDMVRAVSDLVVVHPAMPPETVTVIGLPESVGCVCVPPREQDTGFVGVLMYNRLGVLRANLPVG